MSDKEILQAAARAAGIDGTYTSGAIYRADADPTAAALYWRPLDDDGDALRLAVALRLELDTGEEHQIAVQYLDVCVREATHGDPYAATRRAIVRAAAALAKEMT